jgi:hypothetical protein
MLVENVGNQADLLWLASERSWVFRQEGTGAGTALKLQSVGGGGNKNFIVQTDGLMGVGTTSPTAKLDVRGDIRLGPSGQLFAPGGEENLRILRGEVSASGNVLSGQGFSVSRPGIGRYTITFTTPFGGSPEVVATADLQVPGDIGRTVIIEAANSTFATIWGANNNAQLVDVGFHFIAIGPR